MTAATTTRSVAVDDLADDLETIRLAKAEIAKWQAVLDAAVERVQERLDDAETGTINGRTAVVWGHATRSSVDTVRLKADMGDALAPYMRTTSYRTGMRLVD